MLLLAGGGVGVTEQRLPPVNFPATTSAGFPRRTTPCPFVARAERSARDPGQGFVSAAGRGGPASHLG
jgi:hypothetical protein